MLSLKCAFCGIAASLKCGGCKNAFYCGKEHQKMDWKKSHKVKCKCYEIAEAPIVGRYLKANRDIKSGEIIVRENPLVFGPKIISTPICLGCNRCLDVQDIPIVVPAVKGKKAKPKFERNYYKCSVCKWPMCNESCEKSKAHLAECQLMAEKKFQCSIDYNADEANKKESAYCVILPLRCLLLKKTNPVGFQKFFNLEGHLNYRLQTPIYSVLKSNLLTFFKTILSLEEFDETTILRTAAILDTNCFEIRLTDGRSKIRAVYIEAAMFSHDCVPNSYHIFDESMQLIVKAAVDIKKGEAISVAYGQTLQSTAQRRIHLRQSKCFDCACQRCIDPTECGTYIGSLLCPRCKSAKLISNNPLDMAAEWVCELCSMQMTAPTISLIQNRLQFEIDNLNRQSPYDLELFLEKYCCRGRQHQNGNGVDDDAEILLHECNSFVVQIKYALTQLYGNVDGFLWHELGDTDLERKISLCRELLTIAEVLEPGNSLFRGKLLLELQTARQIQTQRKVSCGAISKIEIQEEYNNQLEMLNEANCIFGMDAHLKPILGENFKRLAREMQLEF